MLVVYVLIGAIGGLVGLAGALMLGVPLWTSALLYSFGGVLFIVLAAAWRFARLLQSEQMTEAVRAR